MRLGFGGSRGMVSEVVGYLKAGWCEKLNWCFGIWVKSDLVSVEARSYHLMTFLRQ